MAGDEQHFAGIHPKRHLRQCVAAFRIAFADGLEADHSGMAREGNPSQDKRVRARLKEERRYASAGRCKNAERKAIRSSGSSDLARHSGATAVLSRLRWQDANANAERDPEGERQGWRESIGYGRFPDANSSTRHTDPGYRFAIPG